VTQWRAVAAIAVAAMAVASCADVSVYRYRNVYTLVEPVVSSDKTFSDDVIDINFFLDEKKVRFTARNKSSESVTMDWGKASFVNFDGVKHSVSNSRYVFTSGKEDPEPMVINPGVTVTDFVAPVKNVEKLEEWTWYVYPLFNLKDDGARANKGKTIGLDVPVKAKGEWRTYSFRFEVSHVAPADQLMK
jgi:hypothetical protein